jgi:deazaflavin-dependent oxidoreductase (nitroreductase family)
MGGTTLEENELADEAARKFPLRTTNLYKILSDPGYRQSFNARLRQSNRFIAQLYKVGVLPLLGMSKQIMVLTTRGRKSNEMRDTPIGYFRLDGVIHVFSGWGKRANWYKNMLACPDDVYIRAGLHRFQARPEVLDDARQKKLALQKLAEQDPHGAKVLMGWDPEIDCLETADFSRMVEEVVIVRFHPR